MATATGQGGRPGKNGIPITRGNIGISSLSLSSSAAAAAAAATTSTVVIAGSSNGTKYSNNANKSSLSSSLPSSWIKPKLLLMRRRVAIFTMMTLLTLVTVYVTILYHQMIVWNDPNLPQQPQPQQSVNSMYNNNNNNNNNNALEKKKQRILMNGYHHQLPSRQVPLSWSSSNRTTITSPKSTSSSSASTFSAASSSSSSSSNHNNNHNEEYVSACLLVMDDNHFLIEWLAYHYHVLPLRYLIVAVDPRSVTSPTGIFNRYRKYYSILNMTIVEWHDDDFMTTTTSDTTTSKSLEDFIIKRSDDQHNEILLYHRARQRMFFYRCLQTLQDHHLQQQPQSSSSAWTLLADTDEYVVLNQHVIQSKYNINTTTMNHTDNTTTKIPTIQEPGSVLKILKLEQQRAQEQQQQQHGEGETQTEDQQQPVDTAQQQEKNPKTDEQDDYENQGDDEGNTYVTTSATTTTTRRLTTNKLLLGVHDTVSNTHHGKKSFLDTSVVPPCYQIPRLRFGIRSSSISQQQHLVPSKLFNATSFLTLRWRFHAKRNNVRLNKISKSFIDLLRIPKHAIQPVTSVHRPIPTYCTQRQLHRANTDSVLVIHHYLGTWEQYDFRNDARNGEFMRGLDVYRKATKAQALENDDARLWLKGFVESVGETIASELLQDVGYVPPKTISNSTAIRDDSISAPSQENNSVDHNHPMKQQHQQQSGRRKQLEEKCALLFFGLPRAYTTLVLPSIIHNVLWPNARHNCDVFVHYFYMTHEPEGRKNKGGRIDPESIHQLEHAVHMVATNYSLSTTGRPIQRRLPHVDFIYDTEDAFWMERNATIQKYRNTRDKKGKYLYYPWNAKSYSYPSSLDNIVKQWHSIESVWELMERAMHQGIANYTQVAMLRSDVFYATPFDIYRTTWLGHDQSKETSRNAAATRVAVVPPFALMPVNDRMIYGPYAAIKIWATKRFEYLEQHIRTYPEPGYGMHSERFLKSSIFTAMINQTGVDIVINPDICFFRTRADDSAMIRDCEMSGETRGIAAIDKKALVQTITGLPKCDTYNLGRIFKALRCEKTI